MVTAYVDRLDGDSARLLIGEEGVGIAIPIFALPPGVAQGMVLRLRFTIDSAATNARLAREKAKGDGR